MMRTIFVMTAVCVIWPFAQAFPHAGHVDSHPVQDETPVITIAQESNSEAAPPSEAVSGQGSLKFRVLYTSDHLPALARGVLVRAHGGFAEDRRPGKGEIYFALPDAGILQISSDLKSIKVLDTPQEMRAANMHNTTVWYDSENNGYLAFPSTDRATVFTTTLTGALMHALGTPTSETTFGVDAVNQYFSEKGNFVPTDVEYAGGKYFVTTGYSKLDYVLSAEVSVEHAATQPSISAAWTPLAFGGKGTEAGQFGTGHGITLTPDGKTLIVADRPNSELDGFTQSGVFTQTVKLPEGSFPCDVDFESNLVIVGCLHGPDRSKGAPIYILQDLKVISTIMLKEELGLKNFQHIHNAILVRRETKLYIIAQSWNPGDFAILELVRRR